MTKRFQWIRNEDGQADIIDHVESKKICVYNDYGILGFSSAKSICDLLNKQEEEIKSLKLENQLLLEEMKEIRDKLTIYLKIKGSDI